MQTQSPSSKYTRSFTLLYWYMNLNKKVAGLN